MCSIKKTLVRIIALLINVRTTLSLLVFVFRIIIGIFLLIVFIIVEVHQTKLLRTGLIFSLVLHSLRVCIPIWLQNPLFYIKNFFSPQNSRIFLHCIGSLRPSIFTLKCFTTTKEFSFVELGQCNKEIFFCCSGSPLQRIFQSSQWFTRTKEFSSVLQRAKNL